MRGMQAALLAALEASPAAPWVLLGDSMGACLAAAVAAGLPEGRLRHLLVAGWPAPGAPYPHRQHLRSPLRDEKFQVPHGRADVLELLRAFPDFLPQAALEGGKERLRAIAKCVGVGLRLVEGQEPAKTVGCPVTVLRGEADEFVLEKDMLGWRDAVGRGCTFGGVHTITAAGHNDALLKAMDFVVEVVAGKAWEDKELVMEAEAALLGA